MSGIKLTNPMNGNFKKQLPLQNLQRLLVWMTIGQDVKNGDWAIYGARLGCYMTNCTDWDYTQVRDFEYLNSLFNEQKNQLSANEKLQQKIHDLGDALSKQLNINFANFDATQSSFYKETNVYLPRSNQILDSSANFVTPIVLPQYYDVVFISNGESHAEDHYQRLLSKCPTNINIHRVSNVDGIYDAHKQAADKSTTDMFFVVDADAWIVDNFQFPTIPEVGDNRYTYVYHTINPVNYLCYGYGGIKIFSKSSFSKALDSYVDMTTTIGQGVNVISTISNIHKFNTDPFSTWRSAFRECAKLASKSIDGQVDSETKYRLNQWLSSSEGQYYEWARKGAEAGKAYGIKYKDDHDRLSLINNFKLLKDLYNDTVL